MKLVQPLTLTADGAFEEAQGVEAAKQGDAAAFGRLVERYQDRVFNTCVRIVGDRAAAEDLTQDAFLKAFSSIGSFDGRAAFYTWLYRIAVNLCLSARRRNARTPYSLHADGARDGGRESPSLGVASTGPAPDQQATEREQHQLVLAALAELDEDHRVVVVLRDIESMDYAEIADILNVPTGTVKSRLHRARLALREKLEPLLAGT
jgi:RNA polymerase sigma-70 factor (ECF subfamily)